VTPLDGRLVAISVSDAPDRARLGFPQREIDRAVLSICTALVRAGAEIGYGGNLDPDGYTFKIFRHLAGAYASTRDTPFHHFIPEPVARFTRYEDLYAILNEGRGIVRIEVARGDAFVLARPGGGGIRLGEQVVQDDAQLAAWFATVPDRSPAQAHSAARRMVTARADARVILGGKMGVLTDPADAYDGAMPGVVEEAILTLEASKPLVVLGSFGGAARDIAIALGLMDSAQKVPRTEQHASYAPAIEQVASLGDRIPGGIRGSLSAIADDDRAEQTAFQVAALIKQWIATKGLAV
jgi:hypothetical protein